MNNAVAGSRIRQARLSGTTAGLDHRTHAFRPDLADAALFDRVTAARYVDPVSRQCTIPNAMIRASPHVDAVATSALLFGEIFDVFEVSGEWSWGRCSYDSYVGWIPSDALTSFDAEATHEVDATFAPVFSRADIKSHVATSLPFGSQLVLSAVSETFFEVAGTGFLHARHVVAIPTVRFDPVTVAERFIGAPYLWGGRTAAGIDCSGLTQAALRACGILCPRDSDQQRSIGDAVTDLASARRGDLVFFPGHVGILLDERQLLHANAYWMTTMVEPLAAVTERLKPRFADPITAIRRPGRMPAITAA